MGGGGSDGCSDAAREGAAAAAACREGAGAHQPRVQADFFNPTHVQYLQAAYAAYEAAIDEQRDCVAAVQDLGVARPFTHCSEVSLQNARLDHMPFMVNEFAYQTGVFGGFVDAHLDRLDRLAQPAKRPRGSDGPAKPPPATARGGAADDDEM